MTDTSTNDGAGRFVPGELVDITIRGARVAEYPYERDADQPEVLVEIHPDWRLFVDLRAPGVEVTRRAPAEWPPQPADVWRDKDGDTWAVLGDGRGNIEMRCTDGGTRGDGWSDPTEVLTTYGPMVLEYRPGWTRPDPAFANDPVDGEVDERAAMVTAIREFADWLELNTDLPLPYAVDAQAYPETVDEARRLASNYGARIARDDEQVLSAKVGIGDRANGYPLVNYTLYLTKPQSPVLVDERGDAEKTQQVEEDAAERRSLEAEAAAETDQAEAAAVCDRCSMPAIQIDGVWQHAEAADTVFCATVFPTVPAPRETAE